MTMPQSDPSWLDSLSPTSKPAPEIPGAFIRALADRRRQRRQTAILSIGAAAALITAVSVGWMAIGSSPSVKPTFPIAVAPDLPSDVTTDHADDVVLTVAAFYSGDDSRERPIAAPGAAEQLRIGDHWDPDRVNAWVLD